MMLPKLSENSDKISYIDFAQSTLLGVNLSDKFLSIDIEWNEWRDFSLPVLPGRSGKISFSEKKIKFPKAGSFNELDKKAIALHSFANH